MGDSDRYAFRVLSSRELVESKRTTSERLSRDPGRIHATSLGASIDRPARFARQARACATESSLYLNLLYIYSLF